jgi:hypothetical protein
MIKRFLIPALLLACVAGTAQAGSITYTDYIDQTSVPYSSTLYLQKFDGGPNEVLTGVTITVSNTVDATPQVYNTTGSTVDFTSASATIPVTATTLTTPGDSVTVTNTTTAMLTGTYAATPGLNTYTATTNTTSSSTSVLPANFGGYKGSGTFGTSVSFAPLGATYSGSYIGSGLFFGGSSTAGGYVSVTYTYTTLAVPEPASMALLGIGMAGLLSFRRLFKRKAVA